VKEMWTVGFRYSWRKTEGATQHRGGWSRVLCGCAPLRETRLSQDNHELDTSLKLAVSTITKGSRMLHVFM